MTRPELRGINPETKDVPEDWVPECDNCRWMDEHYERSNLYLFQSVFDRQWHVNPIDPEQELDT